MLILVIRELKDTSNIPFRRGKISSIKVGGFILRQLEII